MVLWHPFIPLVCIRRFKLWNHRNADHTHTSLFEDCPIYLRVLSCMLSALYYQWHIKTSSMKKRCSFVGFWKAIFSSDAYQHYLESFNCFHWIINPQTIQNLWYCQQPGKFSDFNFEEWKALMRYQDIWAIKMSLLGKLNGLVLIWIWLMISIQNI